MQILVLGLLPFLAAVHPKGSFFTPLYLCYVTFGVRLIVPTAQSSFGGLLSWPTGKAE